MRMRQEVLKKRHERFWFMFVLGKKKVEKGRKKMLVRWVAMVPGKMLRQSEGGCAALLWLSVLPLLSILLLPICHTHVHSSTKFLPLHFLVSLP